MIKKLVYLGIILLVLSAFYGLIRQLQSSLGAGKRLEDVQTEVNMLEDKNQELQRKLSFVQSTQFIERVARDKLDLTRSGETLVIIPSEDLETLLNRDKKPQEEILPNWRGWLKVFWR